MTELQKFLFEGLPVRGAIVRVQAPWQQVLERRAANTETGAYPPAVSRLLGEMVAAGLLMQANIHFEGSLILQIQGDGPVRLAVAEVDSSLRLRATAQLAADAAQSLAADASLPAMLDAHGQGRCAITLDAGEKRPGQQAYQGIVALRDAQGQSLPSLSAVLQQYMQQSEQLDTVIVLAANEQVAAGLLVQRIPIKGQGNLAGQQHDTQTQDALGANEDFNRIATLAASLKTEELLELDAATILRRLFWQETLQAIDTEGATPHFACQCSRERVANMLRGLGQEQVQPMLEENGKPLEIGCEFCGAQYAFDAVDIGHLFAPLAPEAQQGLH